MSQLRQMNLEVKLDDQATFDNFYAPKGSSQQLAKFLLQESGQQFVCIVGNSGSGLSHLLHLGKFSATFTTLLYYSYDLIIQ